MGEGEGGKRRPKGFRAAVFQGNNREREIEVNRNRMLIFYGLSVLRARGIAARTVRFLNDRDLIGH